MSESRWVMSDSLRPNGLYGPWNSPGQNTGVGSLSLLQGIFPAQGSNPGPLNCRRILYQLSHKGSPEWELLQILFKGTHSLSLTQNQCCRFFFLMIFWCGPFLKSLYWICYNIASVLVFWLPSMWDLSPLAGDQTRTLCTARWGLNHWNAGQGPALPFFNFVHASDIDGVLPGRAQSLHWRGLKSPFQSPAHQIIPFFVCFGLSFFFWDPPKQN